MSFPLAILASGSGTNCQAMIDASQRGTLDITIKLIASNKPSAPVLERAKKAGIPHLALDHTRFATREDFDAAMVDALLEHGCKAAVLAGYMRIVSPLFLQRFPGPVLNLHPALLPSFPGLHGAKDALDYGVKVTGCTVHFVTEHMDNGPVIIQAVCPLKDTDDEESLLSRIHAMEHRIYPQAVEWLAEGRLTVSGRKVILQKSVRPKALAALQPDCFVWPPLEEGF
ncbi:MAG: phosphoribosylglycinamide formyltransferase [Desulfovibrio sp.]|nr:phosphoribosylglycinamide formyltransferase [Desulfovibrio sp.]